MPGPEPNHTWFNACLRHDRHSVPPHERFRRGTRVLNVLLATTLFRCSDFMLFFAGWSTMITVLNHTGHEVVIDPALLTVIGTVLGFVISYSTTSSIERYIEGHRLWSEIIYATGSFARTVWIHVPNPEPIGKSEAEAERIKVRALMEKKTIINMLGAYAVAVKHHLRGEFGCNYEDFHGSVGFLPPYIPPPDCDLSQSQADDGFPTTASHGRASSTLHSRSSSQTCTSPPTHNGHLQDPSAEGPHVHAQGQQNSRTNPLVEFATVDMLPAQIPRGRPVMGFYFLSLLGRHVVRPILRCLVRRKQEAPQPKVLVEHRDKERNIPLEISLYLASYIVAVQHQEPYVRDPTINNLWNALNLLTNSAKGLERIIMAPIPFTFSVHLWSATTIYCLLLPSMIWKSLGWLTIPASVIVSFLYFGFLVARWEIENPLGYDQNDLKLDYFTKTISEELKIVTSMPPPNSSKWVFDEKNKFVFATRLKTDDPNCMRPCEWEERSADEVWQALKGMV